MRAISRTLRHVLGLVMEILVRFLSLYMYLFIQSFTSDFALAEDQPILSPEKIVELKKGVFEIVSPKSEDLGVVYAEPLPVDILPLAGARAQYNVIGNAFHIGKGLFLSAAHIFSVELPSQASTYAIRSVDGNIFPIKKFLRYSQYRDVVLFNLTNNPQDLKPLKLELNAEIGTQVYSVVSDLGEGIVFRQGKMVSRPYEPYEGGWRNIRFSAPALPGNSGGPLLNASGKVVGVITRKPSNESLNYALPVSELGAIPSNMAEFYYKGMTESESGNTLTDDWKFETKLPASHSELSQIAQQSLMDQLDASRQQFINKHGKEIFPLHPGVNTYLRSQVQSDLPGVVELNGGRWQFNRLRWQFVKLDDERKFFFDKKKIGVRFDLVIDKPSDIGAQNYLNDPKRVHDLILQKLGYYREVANRKIKITSVGESYKSIIHQDSYERRWLINIWRVIYNNSSFILACHPLPSSLACLWQSINTSQESGSLYNLKLSMNKRVIPYSGSVADWEQYYQADQSWVPSFLRNGNVKSKEGVVDVQLGNWNSKVLLPDMNQQSMIYVPIEYRVENPQQLVVAGLKIFPFKDRRIGYAASEMFQPLVGSSRHHRDTWQSVESKKAPYDGKVVSNQKNKTLYLIQPSKQSEMNINKKTMWFCYSKNKIAVKELEKNCTFFKSGFMQGDAPTH